MSRCYDVLNHPALGLHDELDDLSLAGRIPQNTDTIRRIGAYSSQYINLALEDEYYQKAVVSLPDEIDEDTFRWNLFGQSLSLHVKTELFEELLANTQIRQQEQPRAGLTAYEKTRLLNLNFQIWQEGDALAHFAMETIAAFPTDHPTRKSQNRSIET